MEAVYAVACGVNTPANPATSPYVIAVTAQSAGQQRRRRRRGRRNAFSLDEFAVMDDDWPGRDRRRYEKLEPGRR
jgi:hypothetical protein